MGDWAASRARRGYISPTKRSSAGDSRRPTRPVGHPERLRHGRFGV